MYRVFRQIAPEPTGRKFTGIDPRTGKPAELEWFRSRLVEVGYAASFREAKRITPYPICEEVTDTRH